MSFNNSQNEDQWGSSVGSSAPAYSSQPNYQSPASPAFQNTPGAVPVIDSVALNQGQHSRNSQNLKLLLLQTQDDKGVFILRFIFLLLSS